MNQIKFNDWSQLGLKKDIEQIKKKIDSNESIVLSICIEVTVAVGTIILDRIFNDNVAKWIWIISIIVAILIPLIPIISKIVLFINKILCIKKGLYSITEFVDTFDNSICYWAMMCSSFSEQIKNDNLSEEEKVFYYQEVNYYINKTIYKLDEMTPIVDKVFSNNIEDIFYKHVVSIQRLDIILNMLKQHIKFLSSEMINIDTYKKCINDQEELNKEYIKMMNRFLAKMKESFGYKFEWDDNC